MMKKIIHIVLLALLPIIPAAARDYEAGRDYFVLPNPVASAEPAGSVTVEEFFWYGCPACYDFEPVLQAWHKKRAESVTLRHLPAMWNERTWLHARMFFAAQSLQMLDEMHSDFFFNLHQKSGMLRSEKQVQKMFSKYGVDARRFRDIFHSFEVEVLLKKASKRANRYNVRGTPEMVVNGRYRVTVRSAGGASEMLRVVDYLVGLEEERLAGETARAAVVVLSGATS